VLIDADLNSEGVVDWSLPAGTLGGQLNGKWGSYVPQWHRRPHPATSPESVRPGRSIAPGPARRGRRLPPASVRRFGERHRKREFHESPCVRRCLRIDEE